MSKRIVACANVEARADEFLQVPLRHSSRRKLRSLKCHIAAVLSWFSIASARSAAEKRSMQTPREYCRPHDAAPDIAGRRNPVGFDDDGSTIHVPECGGMNAALHDDRPSIDAGD